LKQSTKKYYLCYNISEKIFLLTNNESKVLYNDKIVIKDIFDNMTFKQNNLVSIFFYYGNIIYT